MSKLVLVSKINGVTTDEDGLEVEHVSPAVINGDTIRAFYARRGGKPGSRITFTDGGGFAVKDSPQELLAALGSEIVLPVAPVAQIADATVN